MTAFRPLRLFLAPSAVVMLSLGCAEPAPPPAAAPERYEVDAAEAPTRSVTPDGKSLLYLEEVRGGGDHLFLRDLTTGDVRPLTEGAGTAAEVRMSLDGRLIAYTWVSPSYEWPAEDRLVELRMVGIDGSGLQVLYSNRDVRLLDGGPLNMVLNPPLLVHEWSPDGRYLSATLFEQDRSQLLLFSAVDASVRVLRTVGLESLTYASYTSRVRFSPNSHLIAYDATPLGGGPGDIFSIPVDGGLEVPLVQHPADDVLLDWTPDGRGVLFASDRSGRRDLWVIEVVDGRPEDAPRLVFPDIGSIANGIGFTSDGSYYYGVAVGESEVYLATLDQETGRLDGPTELVRHTGSRTSAQWSPDGQYLAYAWGAGSESDPFVLGIRTTETGAERRLPIGGLLRHGGHGFDPQWSPDGRVILADARERGYLQGQGLYGIELESGDVSPIILTDSTGGYSRIESPAWASDGRVIFEQRPPQRILTLDVATGATREIYRPIPPAQVHHWPTSNLSVSPDGRHVAFVWTDAEVAQRTTALFVIPTQGGVPLQLMRVQSPELFGVTAWMPDSRHIVFARSVADDEGMFEFWRISAEGGEPENLGLRMEGRVPYGLSIHPDGKRVAFTAGREQSRQVWVLKNFLPPW